MYTDLREVQQIYLFKSTRTRVSKYLEVTSAYSTANTNDPRARREKKGEDSETVPNWGYGELRNLSMQNLSLHLHVTVRLVPRALIPSTIDELFIE